MQKGNRQHLVRQKIGPTMQKVLVLLEAGLALGLSQRPNLHFRIHKAIAKEWSEINRRALAAAIQKLYQSKLINAQEKADGSIVLILEESGRKRAVEYNLSKMKVKKPSHWDGKWHMVIFDIPETKKKARNALSFRLKQIGFMPIQKSVFTCPFPCKDEIDFLIELFDLRPFVRYMIVQDIDIDLQLRKKFNL